MDRTLKLSSEAVVCTAATGARTLTVALMNEPHDISGTQWTNWVATCQLAVNTIRAAGAFHFTVH